MKSYIAILMALMIFGAQNINAQTNASIQKTENSVRKNGKYAILVMKGQHLRAAIQTGIQLKSKSQKIDFQILVCGELVKDISLDKDLQNQLKNAVVSFNLKILVCGLSLDQFKVDKSLLPIETPTTENGLIYMLGLQEQGFKTVIL